MSKFDFQKSTAYFRDNFVPFEEANVSVASSPVLYGLSIYTVFNVVWDEQKKQLNCFRLKEHYERLVASAKILDFHQFVDEWTYDKFKSVMLKLISKNDIEEDVLVRATVFIDELIAGTKIHGLKNSMSAYIYPMGQILNKNGVNVCISSWYRTPDNSIPSRAKINGSYINASLMKNEAILNGFDEAISIDTNGHVCEGTVANLFLVKGGKLITPHTDSDILEGITRNSIIQIANKFDLPVEERSVDRSELYTADEIFFSGSSANITPILSVDKRPIGTGKIGPLTQRLAKIYDDVRRGKDKDFINWLTEVN